MIARPGIHDRAPERLISSGLKLFGEHGFASVSVRQLTRDAGVNLAALNYHLGSKQALRIACAQRAAETMRDAFDSGALVHLTTADIDQMTPAAARKSLVAVLEDVARALLGSGDRQRSMRFLRRELADRDGALDVLEARFFSPVLNTIGALLDVQTHRRLSEQQRKVRALALFGQVGMFVWLEPVAHRHLGVRVVDTSILDMLVTQLRLD